jgi:putative membrane protein
LTARLTLRQAGHFFAFGCLFWRRPGATLDPMLWVKSLHIVFIASWFAGLFYLPRIFVNLAMVPADSVAERERLLLMANKLLRFTTLLAFPALGFGAWLWLLNFAAFNQGWMHAKLLVVLLAIGYHHSCARILLRFQDHRNTRSHVWWRWFNEVPVLLLVAAVVLVVVKPWQG